MSKISIQYRSVLLHKWQMHTKLLSSNPFFWDNVLRKWLKLLNIREKYSIFLYLHSSVIIKMSISIFFVIQSYSNLVSSFDFKLTFKFNLLNLLDGYGIARNRWRHPLSRVRSKICGNCRLNCAGLKLTKLTDFHECLRRLPIYK